MRLKLPEGILAITVLFAPGVVLHVRGQSCSYRRIGTKCYKINTGRKQSALQHAADCWREDAMLAEPLTGAENDQVLTFIGCNTAYSGFCFFSFGLQYISGKWQFNFSRIDLNYSAWQRSRPTSTPVTQPCGEYNKNYYNGRPVCGWNNIGCSTQRKYAVCEKRKVGCLGPAPCQNGGTCIAGQGCCDRPACNCRPDFFGPACQISKPSHNCPTQYVSEGTVVDCACRASASSSQITAVVWTTTSTATLRIKATRALNKREYTCELRWSSHGAPGTPLSTKYQLLVSYGPSGAGHTIRGPDAFVTDGQSSLTLTCSYALDDVSPEPRIEWTGVSCVQGQVSSDCTLQPTVSDQGTVVTCTLQNPISKETSRATYTLSIISTHAHVKSLKIGNVSQNLVTQKKNITVTLQCEVQGKPRPDISVVQTHENDISVDRPLRVVSSSEEGQYVRSAQFEVSSPSLCQSKNKYTCVAKNPKGSKSMSGTITVDCEEPVPTITTEKSPKSNLDMKTVGLGLGLPIGLIWFVALLARLKRRTEDPDAVDEYD
ncbi:hypothetical protein BaRGS_00021560 [Batillaria attramentaria]|uniref:Uncharacterized protein n=1 Tax=Batillaria attramentaria TaxID=370345 RepID=A0ABD0KJ35_9CAEN